MKTILITGVSGSGASYLAEHLIEKYPNSEVHGITRWHSTTSNSNLVKIKNKINLHECDLVDLSSVIRVLKRVKPTHIFHLASYANVRTAFITPLAVLQNNITSTANLFEGVMLSDTNPRIQLCSTSEVYGQVAPEDVPINESCNFKPSSPYAISKVCQDHLAFTYYKNYNLDIFTTRMFAYFNPRRHDLFATSFAMQIAKIESGHLSFLKHGNLDSVRTLIDVRDAMEAYTVGMIYCESGEAYNIGGTTTISVGDFLSLLIEKSKVKIKTKVDKGLLRPSDVTLQIPDVTKFESATNWRPKYSFEESVEHLLNHCRKIVAASEIKH